MSGSTSNTGASDASDVLWLRPQRARRQPQVALSQDEIARVALAIADAEGTDALTMRRIAQDLGCGTMSLYRHVRTKDEVFDLIVDTALGEVEQPAAPSGDWLADLRQLAVAKRTVLLAHPWLARLVAGRPLVGPRALASTEFALRVVADLGLSMDDRVRVINTLHSFVNGFVQTEWEERTWRRPADEATEGSDAIDGSGDPAADWRARTLPYLRHVLDSGRYPYFSAMVDEATSHPDPEADFAWQLQRVLDGLATVVNG
ncbi:TetR/AcrR family transcriptional regulator C-terminal domain-containing protein [Streptomyces sp. NPDC059816]|uniref:TetR/AcrR family transcriptional regulator C-terminal domain-containing protein n=1 Tax=Streptomyces sp. NPDC059816 TaxID=3346960 RepID=UPI0036543F0D